MNAPEPTQRPAPDRDVPMWDSFRLVLDLFEGQAVPPAVVADVLILVGYSVDPRIGAFVEQLVGAAGWTDPAPETSPPHDMRDDPWNDPHLFVHFTRRVVARLFDVRRNTRVEVMAAHVDRDADPIDIEGWRELLADVAAERRRRQARDRAREPHSVDAIRAALERLTDASVTREQAVERAVAELNTIVGVDLGTDPPATIRANRSFSGTLSEVHWNPEALARAMGLASPGADDQPRNRRERRARRRGRR